MKPFPYAGQIFSLLAAIIWAFAVIMFKKSGEKVHPLGLNLFKNILAFGLFIPTILFLEGRLIHPAPTGDYLILAASGILGIGIGDTLYFYSLNLLGAGLSAIIVCLYSPFIILLSVIWLKETLTLIQLSGIGLIIAAIFTATFEHHRSGPKQLRQQFIGVMFGILANAANAVSIVTAKKVLEKSPILWTAEFRLLSGTIALLILLGILPGRKKILGSFRHHQRWTVTITGSVMGAYVAMMVWLAGMKFATASIASALNQTNTVFIFLFASLLLREPLSAKKGIGFLLAMLGVYLVTFG